MSRPDDLVPVSSSDLGHMRTREGMAPGQKNGNLKGKQPEPARRCIRRRCAEGEASLADSATEHSGRDAVPRAGVSW